MLGDPRLKESEVQKLDAFSRAQRPVVSAISLWEVATLVDLGRITLKEPLDRWLRVASAPAAVSLQPLSPEIMAMMNRLPKDFHRDPADRIIVATARVLELPLATWDQKIIEANVVELWVPHA
jgi:PIN domain nuclease of toxin-antitoxin system